MRASALVPAVIVALAASASGQTQRADSSLLHRRANLVVHTVTLEIALRDLSRRSEISIAFSPDIVNGPALVSCSCLDVTVQEALDSLLRGTGLVYAEVAGNVIVGPPITVPGTDRSVSVTGAGQARQLRRVSGRILAGEDGSPVAGALVNCLECGSQTNTDQQGRFVLYNVPPTRIASKVTVRRSAPMAAGRRGIGTAGG